jgi:hypothetical protein
VQIADPGMLAGPGESAPMAKAFGLAGGRDVELDLTPEEIVIRVEVDARFQAD